MRLRTLVLCTLTAILPGLLLVPSATPRPQVETADIQGTITPGGPPVTVTIATAGDNANLSFSGTDGQRVFLKITSNTIPATTWVQLKRPDGTVQASVNAAASSYLDTQTLATSGTYSMYVDPVGSGTGNITLTLYDVPADDSGSISPGGPATMVTIGTPGQNGARSFSGSQGQRVFLKITSNTIPGTTWVRLKRPDGSEQASVAVNVFPYLDTQTLATSGTYTIFVDPVGSSTGSITLTLYDVPADDSGSISPGGPATMVTIGTPGQNGVRSFSGSQGQRVFLKITSNTIPGTTWVRLKRPDGSEQASVAVNVFPYLDTQTLATSGTYTIVVDPVGSSTGSITLTLYDVPPDETGPITLDGAPVTATIGTPGQNALRTFSGSQGQPVSVSWSNNTIPATTWVQLKKPDGTVMTSVNAALGSMTPQVLPVAGTYTLVVDQAGSGTGSIVLSAQQVGGGNAYAYFVSGGYSYGSQARWTIGAIGHNPDNVLDGGFSAHAIWVGTNNSTFVGPTDRTWVELGVTRGYYGDPGLFYYAAHGINYPVVYEQVNLNELPCCVNAPLPVVGENHLFSVLNSHGEALYAVGIDNVFYWSWAGHSPPSPDYGIGIETMCSGCSGTYVRRTPVTAPQWEDANFNFYSADNGEFRLAGVISGVTQLWCVFPTSFVQALATAGVTC